MIHGTPLSISFLAMTMAAIGFAFGLVYFATLRRTAMLLAAKRGWFAPITLTLGRIAAAIVLLGLAAKLGGAAALLAMFIGFLLARAVTLRTARRAG